MELDSDENKLFCLSYGNSQVRVYDMEQIDGVLTDEQKVKQKLATIEVAPCQFYKAELCSHNGLIWQGGQDQCTVIDE